MDLKEIRLLKEEFKTQYYRVMEDAGNHLATGLSKNKKGEQIIVAMLTNDKCLDLIPKTFNGVEVDIRIMGLVKPL
jgi:hypothetical protein